MAMNTNLAGMSPILGAGANSAGSQQAVPGATSMNTPAIGGATNTFLPSYPTGANAAPMTSPFSGGTVATAGADPGYTATSPGMPDLSAGFAANGPGANAGSNPLSAFTGTNLASSLGLNAQNNPNAAHDFVKAMHKAGYSAGVAGQLWNFLQSGAGFNPQIAQSVISSYQAAQQPGVNRGERDLMAQFGNMGLGASSAAAIGMGDYLSQVNASQGEVEGKILDQMYQQSIQNYMAVLMGGKGNPPKGLFDNILGYMNAASGDMQAAASMGV
jgi:hypothetical protein